MSHSFDHVLAVDWSGARRADGIAIAACDGERRVVLLPPPAVKGGRARWSRRDVAALLVRMAGQGRLLAGMDFPFSMPQDIVGHISAHGESPLAASSLWAFVNEAARSAPDHYGRPAADAPIWTDRFYRGGKLDKVRPYRETERACLCQGLGTPWSTVDLHVQNIGVQALAGMRVLHWLKTQLGSAVAIWPFDDPDAPGVRLVIAEIFPRTFIPREICQGRKIGTSLELDAVLARHRASFLHGAEALDHHATDALAAAAALPSAWADRPLAASLPSAARLEGWILGVAP